MKDNSDIDIFFLGSDLEKSIRGREHFMNVEFDYFITPEWKYYDRINTDLTSISIYSKGIILLDTDGIFEAICHDGIDMFDSDELSDFGFLHRLHLKIFK